MSPMFDFTKNMRLMKIKAREFAERIPLMENQGFADVGTVLYDLKWGSGQENPIEPPHVVARLWEAIHAHLRRHDAPAEVFERYGLAPPT